jgi:glycosyltransferase involved in cell wall biosynthesis
MRVAQINYVFDEALTDPEALLDRYTTLTGWGEGLVAAGAARVLAFQRFGRDASFTRNGVEYVFCRDGGGGRPRPWVWSRRLHQAVAGAKPDVAHVNGLDFTAPIRRLRRALGRHPAIVVQDHGGHSSDPLRRRSSLAALLRRPTLQAANGFLFTAGAQAEPWRRAGVIAPEQPVIQVLESSTRLQPIARSVARAASGLTGTPAVLWVGRLNANKDPLTVLDGFERSLAHLPQAELTMVHSEDDLLPAVCARLDRSALLSGRVRLVGRVSHQALPAYYSAADLFVLGSHHEGSGYALIEACACGAVPVVTAIPSFRAITADGSIGGLWTPGDAADCARALVEIGRQDLPALRQQVEHHFSEALSWETVGRQALAAYRELVIKGHARSDGGLTRV